MMYVFRIDAMYHYEQVELELCLIPVCSTLPLSSAEFVK